MSVKDVHFQTKRYEDVLKRYIAYYIYSQDTSELTVKETYGTKQLFYLRKR